MRSGLHGQCYEPKTKNLIIFGTGDLAQIAYEYFTNDSEYEVVAFTVDRAYMPKPSSMTVIPFDEMNDTYPPDEYEIFVAMIYGNMNRDREAKAGHCKLKGYKLASYISPHAFVSPSAKIGEHCFIFENNVIQTGVTIEDNCILWSGNHIGHHSTIHSSCFISSHVVVSGHCEIGSNCFIGVNSTMANNTTIGKESWVSPGAIMSGDIPARSLVKPITGNTEVVPLNEAALNRSLARASQKARS